MILSAVMRSLADPPGSAAEIAAIAAAVVAVIGAVTNSILALRNGRKMDAAHRAIDSAAEAAERRNGSPPAA